jgi:CheY-like chemotaxis protein
MEPMTKILLVEDDKSLREIYGTRLLAEGYDIVSAGDGEEALADAIREKPDLIISDVMMPKISGFEMLDLLRSNPATKDVKVIMMTALSSEQQRERGERLGADRYLVKSQVGIEDVVNTVHDVLGDRNQSSAAASAPSTVAAPTSSTDIASAAANPTTDAPTTIAPDPAAMPPAMPITSAETNPVVAEPVTDATAPTVPAASPSAFPPAPATMETVPTDTNPSAAALNTIAAPSPVNAPGANPVVSSPVAPNLPPSQNDAARLVNPVAPNAAPPQPINPMAPPNGFADPNESANTYNNAPSVDLTQNAGFGARVIEPTGDTLTPQVDINALLANENVKDMGLNPNNIASTNPPTPTQPSPNDLPPLPPMPPATN